MATTSVFLSHSSLIKSPPPPATSHHHHHKHQHHHLWGFSKGLRTKPINISISGLGPRQIRCIQAKATSPSEWYWNRADALKEELKKRVETLPVQQWREKLEVEKVFSPLGMAKLALWASLAVCAVKSLMNPYFWTYCSWFLVVWPWPTAIFLAISSVIIDYRKNIGHKTSVWEQFLILTGTLTWLAIVPYGCLYGYIDGWPLNLFFVYVAYFLIHFYLRKVVYGGLDAISDFNMEWVRKNSISKIGQIAFVGSMLLGHWYAAYETPAMKGGVGNNFWPCVVIVIAMFLHYFGSYFFLKYAAGQVKPVVVVMFGPYRWIRHPIYASNMLLFLGYFLALRAYQSLGFVLVASFLYYNQKSKLEEKILEESGDVYITYRSRVKHRFIPFIY